jgi:hypothetical protein
MLVHFDEWKSRKLRNDPRRGIGFEEVEELFRMPFGIDHRLDAPEIVPSDGLAEGFTQ